MFICFVVDHHKSAWYGEDWKSESDEKQFTTRCALFSDNHIIFSYHRVTFDFSD